MLQYYRDKAAVLSSFEPLASLTQARARAHTDDAAVLRASDLLRQVHTHAQEQQPAALIAVDCCLALSRSVLFVCVLSCLCVCSGSSADDRSRTADCRAGRALQAR